jgi:AraC-like DNA-binding protein
VKQRRASTKRDYDEILASAREYIAENYDDSSLSLDDFCEAARCSRRSVQRALLDCGTSWRELLREKRLEVASGLLVDSELSIALIARRAGYSHSSHMGRAFCEQWKISPAEFRANHRHRGDDTNGAG